MTKAAYVGISGKARKIKKGYIGVGGIANRKLPSGYTQVEYVESDGASYFDTGFVPNQDTKVVMEALIPSEPSSIAVLFGARPNEGSSSDCVMVLRTASGVVRSYYDDSYIDMSSVDSLARLSVLKDRESTNVNGVTVAHTYAEFSPACSLFLAAMNAGGTAKWHAILRIYSCGAYDNDRAVRFFYVPCISPDGVVGLFDLASMAFNAGVGTFTAGPVVSTGSYSVQGIARKIKKAYIGVGGVARPFWAGGELAYYGTATSLGTARRSFASTAVGDYAIFGGGRNSSSVLSTVDAYDKTLTRTAPNALATASAFNAAASVGDYALIGGGCTRVSASSSYSLSGVNSYDKSLTRSIPTALYKAVYHLAAASFGDYALFGGGYGSSGISSSISVYDTSLTRTIGNLATARQYLAATTVGNYALFGGGGATATVEAFDQSLTRTTPTAMSVKRNFAAATSVGGYALFGGGHTGSNYTAVVDAYDESLTRSTPTALSAARQYPAATSVNGYALFGGGNSASFLSAVEAYDETLTRSLPTELSAGRSDAQAVTVGNYALFGGGCTSSSSYSNAVDVYTIA